MKVRSDFAKIFLPLELMVTIVSAAMHLTVSGIFTALWLYFGTVLLIIGFDERISEWERKAK
jgi:hypothetical protein